MLFGDNTLRNVSQMALICYQTIGPKTVNTITTLLTLGSPMSAGAWISWAMREPVSACRSVSLRGHDVAAALNRIGVQRGLPKTITCDHGPKFTGRAMDLWAYRNGVKFNLTRPRRANRRCLY